MFVLVKILVFSMAKREILLFAARIQNTQQQHCCELLSHDVVCSITVKQKNTAVSHLEVFIAEYSLKTRLWRRETKMHDIFVYKKLAAVCYRSVRTRDQRGRSVMLRLENFWHSSHRQSCCLFLLSTR